ncbi:MAG: ATP synthase archaeal subunit H [Candidatus Methanoperedens sp.]
MSRAEILSEIKQAEEEATKYILLANDAKAKKISDARAQSREIIKKAQEEAAIYSTLETSKAREIAKKEREISTEKGKKEAQDIKTKARKNIAKANTFILTEFERAVNA